MIRILQTAEPASDELPEAVRWYEARRAGLGGESFDGIADTFELIKARPEIGSAASADRQTRRVIVPRFPYQVIYCLRPSEIVIVAVAHLKRRPGYWKSRN